MHGFHTFIRALAIILIIYYLHGSNREPCSPLGQVLDRILNYITARTISYLLLKGFSRTDTLYDCWLIIIIIEAVRTLLK